MYLLLLFNCNLGYVFLFFDEIKTIIIIIIIIITRASVNGKPESENATVFLAKRGVMVPGVSCVDCGNWG